MYQRSAISLVKRLAKGFPAVMITGPRQSGKTTLAREAFPNLPYVLFEDVSIREQALRDPRAFLEKYRDGAIFDEVQHVPDLVSYLQGVIDADERNGRFVLTGSQNFSLSGTVSQSLAGRIGMVVLLPLSLSEINNNQMDWRQAIFKGGYPRLHAHEVKSADYYSAYLYTYVERDARQIMAIDDTVKFQRLIRLCAGRIGQVLNVSSLAVDADIAPVTAERWLRVLEASYIIFRLQPYHTNYNKRLTKQSKLYFYDTGLACYLLGLNVADELESHYAQGILFENLVVLELMKMRLNSGVHTNMYFWRDRRGGEIDVIAEWGGGIHAIEIKSGTTFRPDFMKEISAFRELEKRASGYLIYNGVQDGTYDGNVLVPLRGISTIFYQETD